MAARPALPNALHHARLPWENPFIDAFNGRFRQECLDQHWFASLDEARTIIEAWRKDYNTVRPHTALANLTPAAYKTKALEQMRLAGSG